MSVFPCPLLQRQPISRRAKAKLFRWAIAMVGGSVCPAFYSSSYHGSANIIDRDSEVGMRVILQSIYSQSVQMFGLIDRKRNNIKLCPTLHLFKLHHLYGSRDSLVGIATGCGVEDHGSIPGRSMIFVSNGQRPDGLWSPPSFLFNVYQGSFRLG
jgi:hypothetical protein